MPALYTEPPSPPCRSAPSAVWSRTRPNVHCCSFVLSRHRFPRFLLSLSVSPRLPRRSSSGPGLAEHSSCAPSHPLCLHISQKRTLTHARIFRVHQRRRTSNEKRRTAFSLRRVFIAALLRAPVARAVVSACLSDHSTTTRRRGADKTVQAGRPLPFLLFHASLARATERANFYNMFSRALYRLLADNS